MKPHRPSDGPLFEYVPKPRGRAAQEAEISRVRSRIARAVQAFVLDKAKQSNPLFHAEDLRQFVELMAPGAPGSLDRIQRDLRQRGLNV